MRINDLKLFQRKLLTLLGITVTLVPLIHYKLLLPIYLYLGALLALHVYIFFIYLTRVDWHNLRQSRAGFITRLAGIGIFSYLLTLLHYQGPTLTVILSVVAAVALHAAILLLLMVSKTGIKNPVVL
jgi:hypothetical protein